MANSTARARRRLKRRASSVVESAPAPKKTKVAAKTKSAAKPRAKTVRKKTTKSE